MKKWGQGNVVRKSPLQVRDGLQAVAHDAVALGGFELAGLVRRGEKGAEPGVAEFVARRVGAGSDDGRKCAVCCWQESAIPFIELIRRTIAL